MTHSTLVSEGNYADNKQLKPIKRAFKARSVVELDAGGAMFLVAGKADVTLWEAIAPDTPRGRP